MKPSHEMSIKAIESHMLPIIASCRPEESYYNPAHCLAVYFEPDDEGVRECAAMLVAESISTRNSHGCTLLEGIPQKPPKGCFIIASQEKTSRWLPPQKGSDSPAQAPDSGYVLHIGEFCILAADAQNSMPGAHTTVQILASCPTFRVPKMQITDVPKFADRSIFANFMDQAPDSEYLVKMASFCSTFKGNRLHFMFKPEMNSGSPQVPHTIDGEDGGGLGGFCLEYGTRLVPWVDIIELYFNHHIGPDRICGFLTDIAHLFESDSIGLGLEIPGGCNRRMAADLVEMIAERLGQDFRIYAGANLLCGILETESPPKLEGMRALLPMDEYADERFELLKKHNVEIALHSVSQAEGFATASVTQSAANINATIKMAGKIAPQEFGFTLSDLEGGHSFESDIPAAMVATARGWDGAPEVSDAFSRFVSLAYGDKGEDVLNMTDCVARSIPEELYGNDGKILREAAFGKSISQHNWNKLSRIDWDRAMAEHARAEDAFRLCSKNVTKNIEIFNRAALPIIMLRLLHNQVELIGNMREHYLGAKEGTRGSLPQVVESIETLISKNNTAHRQIRALNEACGLCGAESASMIGYAHKLEILARDLKKLDANSTLPSPKKIGLPPW